MWVVDFDLSLAWTMAKIDSGFPVHAISLKGMEIVSFFSFFCFGLFSCFLSFGWVTSLVAFIGKTLWSPVIIGVELLGS